MYINFNVGEFYYCEYLDHNSGDGYRITQFEIENIEDDTLRYFRERYHIEHTPQAINKNIPARTKKEY